MVTSKIVQNTLCLVFSSRLEGMHMERHFFYQVNFYSTWKHRTGYSNKPRSLDDLAWFGMIVNKNYHGDDHRTGSLKGPEHMHSMCKILVHKQVTMSWG